MSIPIPKFCVGEEVAVVGKTTSDYDTDRTEVVASEYWENGRGKYPAGWRYKTAHQPDKTMWWLESSLRKIPTPKRTDWEDCIWQPDCKLLRVVANG